MSRKKRVSVVPLEKRICAYKRCQRVFKPTWPRHIYHSSRCRFNAFYLRQAERRQKVRREES
jgi:hypothetical protein